MQKVMGRTLLERIEIDRELKTNDKLTLMRTRLNQVEMLQKGWDDWVEMENIKTQLKEIPQFDRFPEDPIPRLDSFVHLIYL